MVFKAAMTFSVFSKICLLIEGSVISFLKGQKVAAQTILGAGQLLTNGFSFYKRERLKEPEKESLRERGDANEDNRN